MRRSVVMKQLLFGLVGLFVALVPLAASALTSPAGRPRLIEIRAERLVIPPVAVDLSASLPRAPRPENAALGIGIAIEITLDGSGRVLDAVAGRMTWYHLVAGEWSVVKKAHLPAKSAAALEQAAIEGALASVLVIPDGQEVVPSGLYRGLAEVHWIVPDKGPLPGGVGGVVIGRPRDENIASASSQAVADTLAPELIEKLDPVYPEDARAAGIKGKVLLRAAIDTDGNVTEVKVLSRGGQALPSLDEAVREAVRQWRYRPALRDGKPVPTHVTVAVEPSAEESSVRP